MLHLFWCFFSKCHFTVMYWKYIVSVDKRLALSYFPILFFRSRCYSPIETTVNFNWTFVILILCDIDQISRLFLLFLHFVFTAYSIFELMLLFKFCLDCTGGVVISNGFIEFLLVSFSTYLMFCNVRPTIGQVVSLNWLCSCVAVCF